MLLLLDKSPLRRAVRALLRARSLPYTLGNDRAPDLFERALDCDTLVYAPTSNLLAGWLEPRPDPERMRTVLAASCAPGCSTLVVVVPSAAAYEPELDILRRDGKPYVIVEAMPLVEEFGCEIAKAGATPLWLPRSGSVPVTRADAVARAVLDASETEFQGRVHVVPATPHDLATLFRDAARATGAGVRVHAVWPPLHRIMRPVARWVLGTEPPALALAAKLEQQSAAPLG